MGLAERFADLRSRFPLGDQRTQLALASIAAVVVMIGALMAFPDSADEPAGSVTDRAADALEDPGALGGGDLEASTAEEVGPLSGNSGARSSGNVSAPSDDGAGGLKEAPPSLPPITDTTIKVGIFYIEDPGSANAAAGFAGIGQVDQKRGWDAMIKEVNKTAPFGRKLVPVYYKTTQDEVQSKGGERIAQEVCAKFTQDNPVFIAWYGDQESLPCFTKAKVPQLGGQGWSETYKKYPYLVTPSGSAMDRMAQFQVDQLRRGGYFSAFKQNPATHSPCSTVSPCSGKPKIGLIRYNEPEYKAAATAMKKRLATHGLSLCEGCEFEVAYSDDNVRAQLDDATEVQSAINSFKSKGVTHVLFLGTSAGGRITLFFVDGAEKQNYRPRLGLNPNDLATLVRNFLGPASYPQFRESVLVSDTPSDFEEQPPAYKTCKKIFEDAGETFGGDDKAGNKAAQIGLYCDTAWYFRSALNATGRALSLETWMNNGVAKMTPVSSAGVYLMRTKADRHDGSSGVKVGKWANSCNCWKPSGGIIPV